MLQLLQSKTASLILVAYLGATVALIFKVINPDEWKTILQWGIGAIGVRGLGEGVGKGLAKKNGG